MGRRLKVLFLCTGNSCRSQMAEGWARRLKADVIEPWSAGVEVHGLNPLAVKVMAEAGVDISGQRSKHVDELRDVDFDCVVTVCDRARESCPLFLAPHPRTASSPCHTSATRPKVIHVSFDDPPQLARDARSEAEALPHYRRVRDQIRAFIETLPEALTDQGQCHQEGASRE